MSGFAVKTEGLGKVYENVHAVQSLNLSIFEGEMFGLVGPDGAGKTTTIRMLCGILAPTTGRAKILGFDLERDKESLKSSIGYLSQNFSLYGDLTVDENLEFFAEIHKIRNYRTQREELLEFTRLSSFRKRLAEKLSGGMRQKLALACTLIHRPRLLLLDEPTAGVDPVSRRDFWKILSNLLKFGITILMTTPYMDEAERCTRVGFLNEGTLLAADTPKNLRGLMKGSVFEIFCRENRRAFSFLKTVSWIREVQLFGDRLSVVIDEPIDLSAVLKTLRQEGIDVLQSKSLPPSLENVFISVMQSVHKEGSYEFP